MYFLKLLVKSYKIPGVINTSWQGISAVPLPAALTPLMKLPLPNNPNKNLQTLWSNIFTPGKFYSSGNNQISMQRLRYKSVHVLFSRNNSKYSYNIIDDISTGRMGRLLLNPDTPAHQNGKKKKKKGIMKTLLK